MELPPSSAPPAPSLSKVYPGGPLPHRDALKNRALSAAAEENPLDAEIAAFKNAFTSPEPVFHKGFRQYGPKDHHDLLGVDFTALTEKTRVLKLFATTDNPIDPLQFGLKPENLLQKAIDGTSHSGSTLDLGLPNEAIDQIWCFPAGFPDVYLNQTHRNLIHNGGANFLDPEVTARFTKFLGALQFAELVRVLRPGGIAAIAASTSYFEKGSLEDHAGHFPAFQTTTTPLSGQFTNCTRLTFIRPPDFDPTQLQSYVREIYESSIPKNYSLPQPV